MVAFFWRKASSWPAVCSSRRAGRRCRHNHQASEAASLQWPKWKPAAAPHPPYLLLRQNYSTKSLSFFPSPSTPERKKLLERTVNLKVVVFIQANLPDFPSTQTVRTLWADPTAWTTQKDLLYISPATIHHQTITNHPKKNKTTLSLGVIHLDTQAWWMMNKCSDEWMARDFWVKG